MFTAVLAIAAGMIAQTTPPELAQQRAESERRVQAQAEQLLADQRRAEQQREATVEREIQKAAAERRHEERQAAQQKAEDERRNELRAQAEAMQAAQVYWFSVKMRGRSCRRGDSALRAGIFKA